MSIKSTDMVSTGNITFRADGSAHDTADIVSDDQIAALRAEAVGIDPAQVATCDRALSGDRDARAECARVIQAAAAMGE